LLLGSPPQHRAIRDAHFGQTEQLAAEYHQVHLAPCVVVVIEQEGEPNRSFWTK
jgi:hypothetical protein